MLTTKRTPRLVYTGRGENIFTRTLSDGKVKQLTWTWEEPQLGQEEESQKVQLTHAWPVWAPDESRVACFGIRESDKKQLGTSLYAISPDGIESWELADLAGSMPIYGNWAPRANIFAALIQHGERHLSLETVSLTQPGKTTSLISGAPLFWSWSPRGDRLVVHVRDSQRTPSTAQVLVLDATSGQTIREVSQHPGEFRVPMWSPQEELLAYVEQDEEGVNTLFLFDVTTGEKAPVTASAGMITALWSADGRFLAFGEALRPGSSIFSSVKILDLESGTIVPLRGQAVAGFFWSPTGDALLSLSIDAQRSHLYWSHHPRAGGERTELVRFLPTREQTLLLSFFDQYAISHPPVSPDGSAVTFAGYLLDAELLNTESPNSSARIFVLPLDDKATPQPVARGQFACWNLP